MENFERCLSARSECSCIKHRILNLPCFFKFFLYFLPLSLRFSFPSFFFLPNNFTLKYFFITGTWSVILCTVSTPTLKQSQTHLLQRWASFLLFWPSLPRPLPRFLLLSHRNCSSLLSLTEYSEGESLFYIVSPRDVVVAKERDQDDHIDWLLEKKKYEVVLLSLSWNYWHAYTRKRIKGFGNKSFI